VKAAVQKAATHKGGKKWHLFPGPGSFPVFLVLLLGSQLSAVFLTAAGKSKINLL